MSITIVKPITVEEYVSVFNATQDSDRIERAISLASLIIDGATDAAVTRRWNYVGTDARLVLTDEQKDFVKKAFLVQTQYILKCNLDLTNQSQSISLGGLNFSSSKPQLNQLCEAARNYLRAAGLFYKTEFVGPKKSSLAFLDNINEFVTYSVGDKRYLMTSDKDNTHWSKYIYINSQGNVEYKTIDEIIGITYWGNIDGDINAQTDLMNKFALYYTASECDDKFFLESEGVALDLRLEAVEDSYITKDVNNLTNYYLKTNTYTKTEVDNLIASETAHFLGNYTGGATRPASFDYDTFVKSQIPSGTTVTNNDYVYITWTDTGEYDRCKYDSSTTTWSYEFTIIGDITGLTTRVQTIEGLIPSTATTTNKLITLSEVPTQQNADWNSTGGVTEIKNKPTLSTVATSGSYNDLSDKPTIPAEVSANPTLSGTESELTGLQIGTIKYKVPTGSHLYKHNIFIQSGDGTSQLYFTLYNNSNTSIDTFSLIQQNTDTDNNNCSGYIKDQNNNWQIAYNFSHNTTTIKAWGFTGNGTTWSSGAKIFGDTSSITDTITQII